MRVDVFGNEKFRVTFGLKYILRMTKIKHLNNQSLYYRVKEENRRLLQEKAENEQVIKLLETQKEVLAKSVRDTNLYLELLERAPKEIDI